MIKHRKAFSFIEILLVLAIIGLVSAVFIPASMKIRRSAKEQVVEENVALVISSGQRYNSEKTAKSVDYKTLVDSKYMPELKSVFGETYNKIVIDSSGGSVKVETPDGDVFEKDY